MISYFFQYIAALIMFASGCVFYSADVDPNESGWQVLLLVGRLLAGIAHGITYVTIFVQASENATKDFRRIIVTIIGITIGLSIFIAAIFLISIPAPTVTRSKNVAETSETMSAGIISTATICLSFISVVINFFFSHETVPFLLYHNYREEEAQYAMARLLGEDQHAPIVQQEFNAIREMCHDDYAEFPEGNIFTTLHRRLISIALNARITSAQCLNILCIIVFVKLIQGMIGNDLEGILSERENKMSNESFIHVNEASNESHHFITTQPPPHAEIVEKIDFTKEKNGSVVVKETITSKGNLSEIPQLKNLPSGTETATVEVSKNGKISDVEEKFNADDSSSTTKPPNEKHSSNETKPSSESHHKYKHLFEELNEIISLNVHYTNAVRSVIASWFILGFVFTLLGNYFNMKRGLHFTTFLIGAIMVIFTILHWIGIFSVFFKAFAFILLSIYVHCLSLPVDILNYSYLMECFPTSTKAKAIAFTTICECIFNCIFIAVEIEHRYLHIEFFAMGLLFCVLGFRLYALVPNTNGLSLAAAKHAYIQALSSNWWEFYKKK